MVDPWLVVAIVAIVGVTGGISISVGNINIGNRQKEKDDTQ